MLIVNYNGRLIHVISEDNKQKYRIPINGVTTNNQSNLEFYRLALSKGYKLSSLHYNKKIKWLYK